MTGGSTGSPAPKRSGVAFAAFGPGPARLRFSAEKLAGRKVSELKPVDRNLANQLVMGVLRWGGELDYQIERLSGKPLKYFDPEVVTILRLGIFQIRFLTRVPKPAIVHEAVEMA